MIILFPSNCLISVIHAAHSRTTNSTTSSTTGKFQNLLIPFWKNLSKIKDKNWKFSLFVYVSVIQLKTSNLLTARFLENKLILNHVCFALDCSGPRLRDPEGDIFFNHSYSRRQSCQAWFIKGLPYENVTIR